MTHAERVKAYRERHKNDPEYKKKKAETDKRYRLNNYCRRLKWNGRHLIISKARVGVCNWCRAVVGIDTKQTQFHHEQYDEAHPERHVIELCAECHKKEGIKHISKERLSEIGRIGSAHQPLEAKSKGGKLGYRTRIERYGLKGFQDSMQAGISRRRSNGNE